MIFIVSVKRTILVIEDNPDVLRLSRTTLTQRGYAVITAATLAEARQRLRLNPAGPDLITLDNDLPDGKGIDFLRELRQTSKIPVIMATGGCAEQARARDAGCDDFIEKPYTLNMIAASIEKLLCRASRDAPTHERIKPLPHE